MTSLVVNCEVNLGFDFFPFILTRHSIDGTDVAPNEPPRAVYFTDGEDIYDRNRRLRFQVSRGKLHRGQETLDVVVKFDFYNNHHADLVKEARLYEKQAKTLQGTALPVFYGIYHATISERPITCLVLEYCGSEMETSLHEVSEEFSFKIAKHLMALHSAGIQNNNISESNIVVKNGEPRLIDLSTATLHTCERTMDIEAGKLRPDALDFACTELHDFASEQGIWEATDIFYYGAVIPKQFITSAESLLAVTPTYLIRTAKGRERILREAAEILRQLGIVEEEPTPLVL